MGISLSLLISDHLKTERGFVKTRILEKSTMWQCWCLPALQISIFVWFGKYVRIQSSTFTWPNSLTLIPQSPINKQHHHDCLGCRHLRWSQMLALRQLDSDRIIQGINHSQILAWINALELNCVGSDIQDHLTCHNERQWFWEWDKTPRKPWSPKQLGEWNVISETRDAFQSRFFRDLSQTKTWKWTNIMSQILISMDSYFLIPQDPFSIFINQVLVIFQCLSFRHEKLQGEECVVWIFQSECRRSGPVRVGRYRGYPDTPATGSGGDCYPAWRRSRAGFFESTWSMVWISRVDA